MSKLFTSEQDQLNAASALIFIFFALFISWIARTKGVRPENIPLSHFFILILYQIKLITSIFNLLYPAESNGTFYRFRIFVKPGASFYDNLFKRIQIIKISIGYRLLEQWPTAFDRLQFRCVRRKWKDLNILRYFQFLALVPTGSVHQQDNYLLVFRIDIL